MDAGKLFGRGIAFPPRVGVDGRLAWSEGAENVRDSMRVLVLTRQGERLLTPELCAGIDRWVFEPNTVTRRQGIMDRLTKRVRRREPRIAVEADAVAAR